MKRTRDVVADDLEDDFALDKQYLPDTKKRGYDEAEEPTEKKNKRKKRKKSSTTAGTFHVPQDPADQAILWNQYLKKAHQGISDLELQDHSMASSHICPSAADSLESLVESALTKGKNKKIMHGAPQVLVICSSALRVLDLIKRLRPVNQKQQRPVMKLFSRHIKLEQHREMLKEAKVDLAVGTPNRIHKLLKTRDLKVNRLRLVVIDCWQDNKMRVVVDMDDTRQDLFAIWKECLLPALNNPDFSFKFKLI